MILCADDYGLRDDINRAILELVHAGSLSAVSCLVLLERCTPAALAELCAQGSRVDLGLHLCLTDERLPLSALVPPTSGSRALPTFGNLLRRALLGRVRPADIAAEVAGQYALFVQKCGRKPDYIDGHLHVHQLPGVRDGLLQFVHSLAREKRPYLRNTALPVRELRRRDLPWLKAGCIGSFGARFASELQAGGLPTNEGFAGIYDFKNWRQYERYFPRFVECLTHPNSILVVHPGQGEEWRAQEFKVLREFRFAAGQPNRFSRE